MAGLAVVKYDLPPGKQYLRRLRSTKHNAIERIFDEVTKDLHCTATAARSIWIA